MARISMLLVVIVGLGGCAGTPTSSESCASPTEQSAVMNELPDRSACIERSAGQQRVAALSSVRQRGTQTRTVGVPRRGNWAGRLHWSFYRPAPTLRSAGKRQCKRSASPDRARRKARASSLLAALTSRMLPLPFLANPAFLPFSES